MNRRHQNLAAVIASLSVTAGGAKLYNYLLPVQTQNSGQTIEDFAETRREAQVGEVRGEEQRTPEDIFRDVLMKEVDMALSRLDESHNELRIRDPPATAVSSVEKKEDYFQRIAKSDFDPSKYTERDYVDAIIQIESQGKSHRSRYEPSVNDTSYGLGQILTEKAKQLERKHADLPRLGENIEARLCDPSVNLQYTRVLFQDLIERYNDPLLAVAGYNAGDRAPFVAACQYMLNKIYNVSLPTDGKSDPQTKKILEGFQTESRIKVDRVFGPETWGRLAEFYEKETGREAPKGIIPNNKQTPHHVWKFIQALEDDIHYLDGSGNLINIK